MTERETEIKTTEGEVLVISAVLEPATQFDPRQVQLRIEAGGPFEQPSDEYMEMINEIARTCSEVVSRMLGQDTLQSLVNEVGITPGSQLRLFELSFRATIGEPKDCTFSVEKAVNPAFLVTRGSLVERTANECKEVSLPIFTRWYPDCAMP